MVVWNTNGGEMTLLRAHVAILVAVSSTTANGYRGQPLRRLNIFSLLFSSAVTAASVYFFIPRAPILSRSYRAMHLNSVPMNRCPRAFARVPVLTRVNDNDRFMLCNSKRFCLR